MAQINKPTDYFVANLHTGTGTTQNIVTGLNMSTNGGLVWNKVRSTTNNHILCDTIRGATKLLHSDLTLSEQTDATSLTSFNTDGWTGGGGGNTNGSGQTFVSWNWLAGGTAVSNTDGSITSSVSASTTSGFSVVSWTGTGANATIGHGLGTPPAMIIVKERNGTSSWITWHKGLTSYDYYLLLNTTAAQSNSFANFQNVAPTNTVFSIGTADGTNRSTGTYIAYCFAEKKGFSKFGSYDGNAGIGAFVNNFQYLGFKPALVLIKCYNAAESWNIFDNKRNGYNYQNNYLVPNTNDAETSASNTSIDLLSNGFNPYYGTGTINRSGKSYIYMAFAENPLVGTNNIPACAR